MFSRQNLREVQKKTIVLGITGGIAAYKAPELVRLLTTKGYRVIPVLTEAASQFVTATTLAAVSGERVRQDLWDSEAEAAMGHIELARAADLLLIAPATAASIGKFANGLADDLLSTVYLATSAPVLLAPAMNQQMYLHRSTQRNLKRLVADRVELIGPEEGDQACGEVGPGRMTEPVNIVAAVEERLSRSRVVVPLHGFEVVVTAGPTREAIDPVRFLSNSSSGRQGFALAAAAAGMGARVTLISGPVSLPTPDGVERIDVVTAKEMHDVVLSLVDDCDLLLAVAAVADYRPEVVLDQKIKKSEQSKPHLSLNLVETEDVVAAVSKHENRPFLVGFAAETDDVLNKARQKRIRKGLDVIVLNDVSKSDIGFDSANNRVTIIHERDEKEIPFGSKEEIAEAILREVGGLHPKSMNYLPKTGTSVPLK